MRAAARSACSRPASARCSPGARPGRILPVDGVWPWRTRITVVTIGAALARFGGAGDEVRVAMGQVST